VISYELAKELWDAGYPFKRRDDSLQAMCLCKEPICNGPFGREFRFEENLYPEATLSELIVACGKDLGSLNNMPTSWAAFYRSSLKSYEGPTPEEAVARLWLALKR
jgi:hypothetical protein